MAAPRIFYVVGDTVRNPGRSGIQNVVRSLAAAMGAQHTQGNPDFAHIIPVTWNAGHKYFCPLSNRLSLGLGAEPLRPKAAPLRSFLTTPAAWPYLAATKANSYEVPLHAHPYYAKHLKGSWLLLPELAYCGKTDFFCDYARRYQMRIAVIFHDAIPIENPEYVPKDLPNDHAEYMRALCRTDLVIPTTQVTAQSWSRFAKQFYLEQTHSGVTQNLPTVTICNLASEIVGVPRETEILPYESKSATTPIRILCVSTLEPRKNHLTLLEAFEKAVALRPDLPLELHLVGAPYTHSWDIVEKVHRAMYRLPNQIFWHEKVEQNFLRSLYRQIDFTVYPSILEGFGLPIIESLWFGRPCLCANFGAMAENAVGGGCYTLDVKDPVALAEGILKLATSPNGLTHLATEAIHRPLKTWEQYALDIRDAIKNCA